MKLIEPMRGSVGSARVFVVDLSLRGFRIAHQDHLGNPGDKITVHTTWEGRSIDVKCTIVRTEIFRRAASATAKTLYHSGLSIDSMSELAAMSLREVIEWHVIRAIDEQKANARGIPTIAAQSFQSGKGTEFKRHQLVNGKWNEVPTTDPIQPRNGFTVSVEHSLAEVQMLREAFEHAPDDGAREMIREMAKLSISTTEGVPTRRYQP